MIGQSLVLIAVCSKFLIYELKMAITVCKSKIFLTMAQWNQNSFK